MVIPPLSLSSNTIPIKACVVLSPAEKQTVAWRIGGIALVNTETNKCLYSTQEHTL